MTTKNSVTRFLSNVRPGNLVSVNSLRLGFVCWVEVSETGSHGFGYLGLDGEYHETYQKSDRIVVWLEHPMIGAHRNIEAQAMAHADL